jgi:thioredoxin-dependent peroxiredoxin
MRIQAGGRAPDFSVRDTEGKPHSLEQYRGRPLLLQFYRYAGCPMCDLRMHDFAREYPALRDRGLNVIAFFHSRPERLRDHLRERALPFPVVGDPTLEVYRQYGVESSALRLLWSSVKPSFYWDWLRSMRHGYWGTMDWRMTSMPADFLIGADQSIRRVHYGGDIGDHMPAATILEALSENDTA